ncbi:PH domain-containing protein [Zunongwangia endophytica]|uniref:PH domain-containing protein n=1 Tax=Zunongwangia endophytica TaxID=1808945 RepID=A0ABV8H7V6_9FLAO|nr:PH domain-containing protein [Zunongwangia endophytica]MDN3593636.1 PH domain-containing protein [Zunongwangia endophytica]
MSKPFSIPQRQSAAGILLIFSSKLYKLLRASWAILAVFILKSPGQEVLLYAGLGFALLLILVAIFSYFDYRKFLFHIDYEAEEFILKKGVFNSDFVSIPFDNIQQVNFERGILQRIAGVYSLVIDTAGSKEKEVKIEAVSAEEANLLADILNSLKNEKLSNTEIAPEAKNSEEIEEFEQEEKWTYRLSLSTLLKTGISSNFLRGFGLIFVFVSTIFNELNQFFKEETANFWDTEVIDDIGGVASNSVFIFACFAIVILVLSILITTGEVFIKYFNLNLTQTKSSLDLQMGLRTNTRVSLKPKRVQILKIITNPIQKKLNLHQASLWLASSEQRQKKDKIQIPGLEKETIEKIKFFLYQSDVTEKGTIFRPHWVDLSRRMILGFLPIILSVILQYFTEFVEVLIWSILAALYLVIYTYCQYRVFNSLELKIGANFISKKSFLWDETIEIIEIYKLQSITIKQPLWYKRRNLVHVVFHSAAGDITFRAVDKSILDKLNYCLYSIERSNKAWM